MSCLGTSARPTRSCEFEQSRATLVTQSSGGRVAAPTRCAANVRSWHMLRVGQRRRRVVIRNGACADVAGAGPTWPRPTCRRPSLLVSWCGDAGGIGPHLDAGRVDDGNVPVQDHSGHRGHYVARDSRIPGDLPLSLSLTRGRPVSAKPVSAKAAKGVAHPIWWACPISECCRGRILSRYRRT